MVTGGLLSQSTVQEYTLSGPQEQLPDLQKGRSYHACALYIDSQDRAVSIVSNITAHLTIVTMHCVVMISNNIVLQVLLVTGGSDGDIFTGGSYLDSTELLLPSATSWSYSAALPSPRVYLRGATLDNKVIMTGTYSDTLVTTHDLRCYQYYSCNNITQWRWLHGRPEHGYTATPERNPGVQCGGGNLDQSWLHVNQQEEPRRLRHQLPGDSRLLQLI